MNFQKVSEHIVKWLSNYIEKSNTQGFVVGISGGIDSALTSTLCALTGHKTILVEMPIHQDITQVSRGREHINLLESKYPNCTSIEINLTSSYDTLIDEFGSKMDLNISEELKNLTLGNSRARLRMTTLYAVAGMESALVCGTGNKIEDFGVGFFTKYGDGGVDISPIADLYKSEVFALAKHLGVVKSILTAPPTDGLWDDGRTDEDQIGATYAELEKAMITHKKWGDQPDRFGSSREKEVWDIYIQRFRANQHKMNPIPVCEIPEDLKLIN